jgi:hypothetical protein
MAKMPEIVLKRLYPVLIQNLSGLDRIDGVQD